MRLFISFALGVSLLTACSSGSGQGGNGGAGSSSSGSSSGSGGGSGSGGSGSGSGSSSSGSSSGSGSSSSGSSSGSSSSGSSSGGGGDGGAAGFRAITMPGNGERVTGFYCSDAHTCVLTAEPFGDAGHVYATDGNTITATLVTGDDAFASKLGTIGTVAFLGVASVGGVVVARVIGAEDAFVSATGPITSASSWTGVLGAANPTDFGLNAQFAFGTNGSRWTLVSAGRIWEATSAPSPTTTWTNVYSPQAVPSIPADIADQRAADPTLCDTDPSVSVSPDLVQEVYVAPDESLVITPAGAVNQAGDDTAGVCISTDGGHTFHHAAFTGVAMGAGPTGITCTSASHCLAWGGVQDQAGSAYVYVSSNASQGASSTWTLATTPSLPEDTELHGTAFAPDGKTGWMVGRTSSGGSLLLTTSDGGATWTDASATISALAQNNPLHSVYAFDATHVWIGGENDTLLVSGP